MSEITIIWIVSILQVLIAFGLVNVWMVRFEKATKAPHARCNHDAHKNKRFSHENASRYRNACNGDFDCLFGLGTITPIGGTAPCTRGTSTL